MAVLVVGTSYSAEDIASQVRVRRFGLGLGVDVWNFSPSPSPSPSPNPNPNPDPDPDPNPDPNPNQELINGRIAMAAITAATGLSISQGTFLNELLDGRLPQSWF